MYSKREIRIFVRCAIAQLLSGNESLANGPLRVGTLDARPAAALARYEVYRPIDGYFRIESIARALVRLTWAVK